MEIYNLYANKNFPQALTKEEFQEYFEKYKAEDEAAKKKLVEHNMRLVIYVYRKCFSSFPYEKEELLAAGTLGLVKALETFELEKQLAFDTYAYRCIYNEIAFYMRKERKQSGHMSISTVTLEDNHGKEKTLEEVLPSKEEDPMIQYEKKMFYQGIREIIEELDEREQLLMGYYFGFYDGTAYPQREIAKKLGLAQSYVSRLLKKTIQKVKNQLVKKGYIDDVETNIKLHKQKF